MKTEVVEEPEVSLSEKGITKVLTLKSSMEEFSSVPPNAFVGVIGRGGDKRFINGIPTKVKNGIGSETMLLMMFDLSSTGQNIPFKGIERIAFHDLSDYAAKMAVNEETLNHKFYVFDTYQNLFRWLIED